MVTISCRRVICYRFSFREELISLKLLLKSCLVKMYTICILFVIVFLGFPSLNIINVAFLILPYVLCSWLTYCKRALDARYLYSILRVYYRNFSYKRYQYTCRVNKMNELKWSLSVWVKKTAVAPSLKSTDNLAILYTQYPKSDL